MLCGRFLPDAHAGFWLAFPPSFLSEQEQTPSGRFSFGIAQFGKRRLNVAADIFAVLSGFVSGLQAPGYDEASADASAEASASFCAARMVGSQNL